MSKSSSGLKAGSLAKCCAFLQSNGKHKKKGEKYEASKSATADVVEKLEDAEKKATLSRKKMADRKEGAPIVFKTEGQPQHTDILTGQAIQGSRAVAESQDCDDPGAVATSATTPTQKQDLAKSLSNPEHLWCNFFSELMDEAADAVESNVEENTLHFTHSREVNQAVQRSKHRFSNVCHFPLKLILTPLKRGRKTANIFASVLEMRFGPLHASLQVGNVVLEWNDTSLVTPYLCAFEDEVMQLDMQPHSTWVKYTAEHRSTMRKSAEELDFSKQIELTYTITSEKKNLIDALIAVIIKYNKHYYYNVIDRNCQHFVLDALEALQVEAPRKFTGELGQYYEAVLKGKTPLVPSEFKTHSDLDKYVMLKVSKGTITDMPQDDLEFVLTVYFRFHVESRSKVTDCNALDEWQCRKPHCCIGEVEKHIRMESMKIHDFHT